MRAKCFGSSDVEKYRKTGLEQKWRLWLFQGEESALQTVDISDVLLRASLRELGLFHARPSRRTSYRLEAVCINLPRHVNFRLNYLARPQLDSRTYVQGMPIRFPARRTFQPARWWPGRRACE
jgi:hypothetical protein